MDRTTPPVAPIPTAPLPQIVASMPGDTAGATRAASVVAGTRAETPTANAEILEQARRKGIPVDQIFVRGGLNPLLTAGVTEDPLAERILLRQARDAQASAELASRVRSRPGRPITELVADAGADANPRGTAQGSGSRSGAAAVGGGEPWRLSTGNLTYESEGGSGTVLHDKAAIRKLWKESLEYPDPAARRDTLLVSQTGDTRMRSSSEQAKAKLLRRIPDQTSWLDYGLDFIGDGISTLEMFDYPRRAAWLTSVGLGAVVPDIVAQAAGEVAAQADAATPNFAPVYDVIDSVLGAPGKAYATYQMRNNPGYSKDVTGAVVRGLDTLRASDAAWMLDPPTRLPEGERHQIIADIIPRLVTAAKEGTILQESNQHPGWLGWNRTKKVADATIGEEWADVFLPGGRTRNISGSDVLNAALPREEARKLAKDAMARGDKLRAGIFTILGTSTGQELFGLAAEVVADPLWLVGPAATTKIVHIGDEAWRLSRPALLVARRLETLAGSWDAAARVVVRAAHGDADAVQMVTGVISDGALAATELRKEAELLRVSKPEAYAQKVLNDAAQLEQDAAQAAAQYTGGHPGHMQQMRETAAKARKLAERVASNPRAYMEQRRIMLMSAADRWEDAARAGQRVLANQAGVLSRPGMIPISVPFGTRTYEVGSDLRRLLGPPVAKVGKILEETGRPWTLALLDSRIRASGLQRGMSVWGAARATLTPAELLAWGAQHTVAKPIRFAGEIWRLLAQAVGTRFVEPVTMAASYWLSLWGRDAAAANWLTGHGGAADRLLHLPGVPREIWDAYQESLGRLFDSLGGKESFLKSQLHRIKGQAQQVLQARKARVAAKDPTAPAEWARPDYGIRDIQEEAASLIEAGAGELERRPELKELVHRFAALRDELLDEGGEELVQHFLRVTRSLQGNPHQAAIAEDLLDRALRDVDTAWQESRQAEMQLEEAGQHLEQLRAMEAALSDGPVDIPALTRALIRGNTEARSGAFREALKAEVIRAAQNDPGIIAHADDIVESLLHDLKKVVGGEGLSTDDVARKLMQRAIEAEGSGTKIDPQRLAGVVQRGMKRLQDEGAKLTHLILGGLGDPEKAHHALLTKAALERQTRLRESLAALERAGIDEPASVLMRASSDPTAKAQIIDVLGEAKADQMIRDRAGIMAHLVARGNQDIGAMTAARIPGFDADAIASTSVNTLLNLVSDGAPLGKILDASKTAAAEAVWKKIPASVAMDLIHEIDLRVRAAPRGTAWRNAVMGTVQEFKQIIRDSVDQQSVYRDAVELYAQSKQRRLAAAEEQVAKAKEDFFRARTTVKAAPGEVVDGRSVGNNLRLPEVRRAAEAWEAVLWEKFSTITHGYTEEEALIGAFSMLRDAPITPARAGDMGRRAGKTPDDIREITESLRQLFNQYEEWFDACGFSVVKDPIERMKMWGTIGYAPHLAVDAEMVARGAISGTNLRAASVPTGAAATDAVLSTSMPAKHLRQIGGTIAEINAAGMGVSMSLGLDQILARYLKANGAISASDFFAFLLKGGVVQKAEPVLDPATGLVTKGVTEVALEAGLVPLFSRPNLGRDIDLLISGSRADWAKAGVTHDELDAAISVLRARKRGASEGVVGAIASVTPGTSAEHSPFASWAAQAPIAQANANMEALVLAARKAGLSGGANPLAPLWTIDDALARHQGDWQKVTEELNHIAERENLSHATRDQVAAFFTDQSWRLYVPGRIAESMARIFEETGPKSQLAKVFKGSLDYINSIYKSLLTIHVTAFSTRNAMGNTMANMMDLGVHGTFSPVTNYDASRLYEAWVLVERYGTLDKAREAGAVWTHLPGLESLWRDGIDLGDGVIRPVQEALRILGEHEALSRAYTVVGDIGRYDESLMEHAYRIREQPLQWAWQNVLRPSESIPNAMFTLSMATGSFGVVLPKRMGEALARRVEGHSRLVNFLANVRRGGSFTEAGQHVQKFLFNYDDLTNFQKTWMRTLVPFFTWTQKNIYLHAEMMIKAPWYYSQYVHMMSGLEQVSRAIDLDAGLETGWPVSMYDTNEQRIRNPAQRSKLMFPVPAVLTHSDHPFLYVVGAGTPVEGFVDAASMLQGLADLPAWVNGQGDAKRAMSMLSWAIQVPAQIAMGQDFYYGRQIAEMNNAARALQWISVLETGANNLNRMGLKPLAAMYKSMAYASREFFQPVITRDAHTGKETTTGPGLRLWLLNAAPVSSMIRKITAAADVYSVSLVTDAGDMRSTYRVPDYVRVINAYFGLNMIQDDPVANRARFSRDVLKEQEQQAEQAGYGSFREDFKAR